MIVIAGSSGFVGTKPDDTLADTARCAATLGFVPTTSLAEVIDRQRRASSMLAVG